MLQQIAIWYFIITSLMTCSLQKKNDEEYLQRLELVLKSLKENGLAIKISECHLIPPSVQYLGKNISRWYSTLQVKNRSHMEDEATTLPSTT